MWLSFWICILFKVAKTEKRYQQYHQLTDVGITLQEKYGIKAEDEDMFPYMINNPQICPCEELHHIILIVSDPQHFKTRNIFRKTWAQPDLLNYYRYRTVYLIGNSYVMNWYRNKLWQKIRNTMILFKQTL